MLDTPPKEGLSLENYLGTLPEDMRRAGLMSAHYVALAKRILLADRVRDFNAADVVALANLIERVGRQ